MARFDKYERRLLREKKLEQSMHGEGLYIYQNNTKGELDLGRATKSGKKKLQIGEQFQGDNYYMGLVKTHDLKYIKEIMTPQQEKDNMMKEQKLILDQPDIVTEKGKVEHVLAPTPMQPLNDSMANKLKPDVLITEDPMSGVEILLD